MAEEIALSPEEDEALDRVWDRIAGGKNLDGAEGAAKSSRPHRDIRCKSVDAGAFGQKHIRKEGGKYVLYSHDGKKVLGRHDTRAGAERQERAVQYFKHGGKSLLGRREIRFKSFDESAHPRADDGRFGSKPGEHERDKPEEKPSGEKPAEKPESKKLSYAERQTARDEQRGKLQQVRASIRDAASKLADADRMEDDLYSAIANDEGLTPERAGAVKEQARQMVDDLYVFAEQMGASLAEHGASAKDQKHLTGTIEDWRRHSGRALEKLDRATDRLQEARTSLCELDAAEPEEPVRKDPELPDEPQEPAEPQEPEYPPEPDLDSFADEADYDKAKEEWDKLTDKMDADYKEAYQDYLKADEKWTDEHNEWEDAVERLKEKAEKDHDKAYDKWDKEYDRWQEKRDRAEEKVGKAEDAHNEAFDKFRDDLQENREWFEDWAETTLSELAQEIDDEEADDDEDEEEPFTGEDIPEDDEGEESKSLARRIASRFARKAAGQDGAGAAMAKILSALPAKALERLAAHAGRIRLHGSPEALAKGLLADHAAHAAAHALNGPGHEMSRDPEWRRAWREEIKGGAVSQHASRSAARGFAEVGRLLYTGGHGLEEVEKALPLTVAFWRGKGLI